MKKTIVCFLPVLLVAMSLVVSCEEVEEASIYDNWRVRNEAFIDSIRSEMNPQNYVATEEQLQRLEEGELFAIRDVNSTNQNTYYIYCKKIKKLDDYSNARRPLYTESVSAYYYGTLINGENFDGNFDGYSATDRGFLDKNDADKAPDLELDSPAEFAVNGSIISGRSMVLQYMYVGERWMVYIPWQSGYGNRDQSAIPAYSALTFDMVLESVVDDAD